MKINRSEDDWGLKLMVKLQIALLSNLFIKIKKTCCYRIHCRILCCMDHKKFSSTYKKCFWL